MKALQKLAIFFYLFLYPISSYSDNMVSIADSKIAVIDIYYLLENSLAVQNVKNEVKLYNSKIATILEAKERELKALEANFKKADNKQSEKLEKDIAYFNKKVKDVQAEVKEKNSKLESAYTKAMKKIDDATKKIVDKLSKKYGFYVTIPSSQIYYASSNIDITEEVLLLLNKELANIELDLEKLK
jgi:Skp family chaperone for outer membrane proteins